MTLAALILVLVVLSFSALLIDRMRDGVFTPFAREVSPLTLEVNADGVIIPPPMTETMKTVLEKSSGFQALVSYTDRGFEPQALSIKQGGTVRFTNNSPREIWVASVGVPYPSGSADCGQSAFDSCVVLKPLEFWEFTFNEKGEWTYADNLHKEFTGKVRVHVE